MRKFRLLLLIAIGLLVTKTEATGQGNQVAVLYDAPVASDGDFLRVYRGAEGKLYRTAALSLRGTSLSNDKIRLSLDFDTSLNFVNRADINRQIAQGQSTDGNIKIEDLIRINPVFYQVQVIRISDSKIIGNIEQTGDAEIAEATLSNVQVPLLWM